MIPLLASLVGPALPDIPLAKASEHGGWEPGIGDPTFFGWLAVFCYFAAAYLAYRAGRLERKLQPPTPGLSPGWPQLARDALNSIRATLTGNSNRKSQIANRKSLLPSFWFTLCAVLVLLGINKQLDLQSCLTQIGRDLSKSEGWYENRRAVQAIFVLLISLLGLATIAATYWYIHSAWRRYRLAFFGIVYLVTFVIIRATSFHHIDIFLQSTLGGIYFNHILELGGILFIAYAAWRATRDLPSPRLQPFEKTVKIR
ncbi:MAG TPA: hypothetical protein VGQ99_23845 [Tepidisphaeraceae bacterium]|nr:hypothetical protein [Tepidisphaeraceae bacterium]